MNNAELLLQFLEVLVDVFSRFFVLLDEFWFLVDVLTYTQDVLSHLFGNSTLFLKINILIPG
jgi:hypothetical protein